jgi:hypothetical protein
MLNMRLVVIAAGLLLASVFMANAAAPETISYQGYLTDSSGVPVSGAVSMIFSLYTSPSGTGAPLWTETQAAVSVANGVYSVTLGSVNPLTLPFDVQYWLGIKAGADGEMTPRSALTSVGYAFRSATTDGLVPGSVTTVKIRNQTITPDKLNSFCQNGQILVRSASSWTCGALP